MSLLAGKRAVVTGVTSGIGAAVVPRLLGEGMSVVGLARDGDALQAMRERLGPAFLPLQVDLAEADARARAFAAAALGEGVHLVVSNAAEVVYDTPSRLPAAAWRRLLDVNLLASIELIQALAPGMKDGHVVTVSSVTARFLPNARFAPYALTKVALDHYTASLRLELDPRGIKVTSLALGLVDTPIYDKVEGFAKAKEKIRSTLPRWLTPEDVADTLLWVVTRPPHVVVGEVALLPLGQGR